MTSRRKVVQYITYLFVPVIALLFACSRQSNPELTDEVRLAGTPIVLTTEARAAATETAAGKLREGFEARQAPLLTTDDATAVPDEAVWATEEADPAVTSNAIIEAQLTKAPTIAAFLTKVAATIVAEGTPSPPSRCHGGL